MQNREDFFNIHIFFVHTYSVNNTTKLLKRSSDIFSIVERDLSRYRFSLKCVEYIRRLLIHTFKLGIRSN